MMHNYKDSYIRTESAGEYTDDAEVIDAEIIEEEDLCGEITRDGGGSPFEKLQGLVLASPPLFDSGSDSAHSSPSLFTLPPELHPQRIIEEQRRQLDAMMTDLQAPPEARRSSPPVQAESSEAFLERAMSQLDRHMAAMDEVLERIVGSRFHQGRHKSEPTS